MIDPVTLHSEPVTGHTLGVLTRISHSSFKLLLTRAGYQVSQSVGVQTVLTRASSHSEPVTGRLNCVLTRVRLHSEPVTGFQTVLTRATLHSEPITGR